MAISSLAVLLLALAINAEAGKEQVTPIQKVTELLKGLQAKVTKEGKEEAATYDKYACFCKEQATEKQANIAKSTTKIEQLQVLITGDTAKATATNQQVSQLTSQISGESGELKTCTDKRATQHAGYIAKAKDLKESIEACGNAIEALRDAKGKMVDAKLDLIQVHSRITATVGKHKLSSEAQALIDQLRQPGKPAAYTFGSNHILDDLLSKFKGMKKELDDTEREVEQMFQSKALGLNNMMKSQTKEKKEAESLAASLEESLASARQSLDEETQDKAANQKLLDTLTVECENKAKLFDQRSTARGNELAAMTQAIDQLAKGVTPNEGANKNLVGLVQDKVVPSFLQIRNVQHSSNRVMSRVQESLLNAGKRIDSVALRSVAVRVQLAGDNFAKVRSMIKDLVKKLEADKKDEADAKAFCDENIGKAVTSRDESKGKEEAAAAQIATLNAQKETLAKEIEDLAVQVAGTKKALNEASELRAIEKRENTETLASAEEGKNAVNMALSVLGKFYKEALVQIAAKTSKLSTSQVPGAPKTFSTEYKGAQAESKGILGMLEVISSDFERTLAKVTQDEATAQAAFDKLEEDSNADVAAANASSKQKEAALKTAEASLLEQQDERQEANKLWKTSVEKLEALKTTCVEGGPAYKERAAKRQQEIAALKEAEATLSQIKIR